MSDLRVDAEALAVFETKLAAYTGPVGGECVATGQVLGSGIVQDALGSVTVVLTTLDLALADGASGLVDAARAVERSWVVADHHLAARPW